MAGRLSTILAFCALFVASNGIAIDSEDDRGLVTLTHSYVGQILTGVDGCDRVYSGLLVECQVKIQHDQSSDQYVLQLEDVSLKKFIGPVNGDPANIAADADWQLLDGNEEQTFISQLNIPTVFHVDQDKQISEVFTTSDEEHQWSLNLKRGILNFFQYREDKGTYTSREPGIQGNCDVLYTVAESDRGELKVSLGGGGGGGGGRLLDEYTGVSTSTPSSGPEYLHSAQIVSNEAGTKYISKVWALDQCEDRPTEYYIYGINGAPWKYYRKNTFIASQSQASIRVSQADISPKRYNKVSGEIRGTHRVRPFSDYGKSITSYTSQKLVFLDQSVGESPDVVYTDLSRVGLRMKLQERNSVPQEASDVNEQVDAFLSNIVNSLRDDETPDVATGEFIGLINKLKHIGDSELRGVLDLYGRRQEDEDETSRQKREILEDALPIVDSNVASLDIIKKIADNSLAGERAAWLLAALAFSNPDAGVLDNLLSVCAAKRDANDLAVASPCYLAFGSLVNTVCVAAPPEKAKAAGCTEERKEAYGIALSKVKVSSDDTVNNINRILIKASGNAGILTASQIDFIFSIVRDLPADLQSQAIYALRRRISRNDTQIRSRLLDIYLDTSAIPESRMAACFILIESQPPATILQKIAANVIRERDPQVAGFSDSHLRSLLGSTYGAYREDILVALALIGDRKFPIIRRSKSYSFSDIDFDRKVGFKAYLNALFSPDAALPIAANFKFDPWIFMRSLNLFEMGARFDWEPSTLPTHPNIVNIPELAAINRQLGITPEQLQNLLPKLSVYLKAYGNEFRHLSVQGHQILPLILQALSQRQNGLQKVFSLGEGTLTVCTDIGIPLSLNLSSAGAIAGSSSIDAPEPGTVTVNLNLRASATAESHLSAQIPNVVQSGVGIKMSARAGLPLDAEMRVLRNGNYRFRLKNLKQQKELLSFKSQLLAFIVRKERRPAGYASDGPLPKYEARQLSSDVCPGSHVHKQSTAIGYQDGIHINISSSSVLAGDSMILSGPYEKKATLISGAREMQMTFKMTDTEISIEDLLSKMSLHHSYRHGNASSSGSSSSSSESGSASSESQSGSSSRGCESQSGSSSGGCESRSGSSSGGSESRSGSSSGGSKSRSGSSSRGSKSQSGSSSRESADIPVPPRSGPLEAEPREQSRSDRLLDYIFGMVFGEGSEEAEERGDNPIPNQGGGPVVESREPLRDPGSSSSGSSRSIDRSPGDHSGLYSGRGGRGIPLLECSQDQKVMQKRLKARQYLLNVTRIDADTNRNQTTVVSLTAAFSEKFLKAWNLQIFPAMSMDRNLEEEPPRVFCAQSVTEFPNADDPEPRQAVRSKLTAQWGQSCSEHNKISYRLKLENSPRDQALIDSYREQCDRNRGERGPLSEECQKLAGLQGDLKDGSLNIAHNGIGTWYKSVYYMEADWVKNFFSRQVDRDHVDVHNTPNQMLWQWSVLERKDRINLQIRNPEETVNFTRIPLPFEWPTYNYNQRAGFVGEKLFGQCKVGYNGQISNFDNLEFGYNLTNCYHVLAEDSTTAQKFSVLSRASPIASGKDLLVFIKAFKIEARRARSAELELSVRGVRYSNRSNDILLLANGSVVERERERADAVLQRCARPGSHMRQHESSRDSESQEEDDRMTEAEQEWFSELTDSIREELSQPPSARSRDKVKPIAVILLGDEAIEIRSRSLYVQFDGRNAIIKVSPKYHRKILGVCGSFAGNRFQQFVGPDKTVYDAGIQAAVAYQNVTDACIQSGCVLQLGSVVSGDCKSVSKWPLCSPPCASRTSVPKRILMKCASGQITKRVIQREEIHTACRP